MAQRCWIVLVFQSTGFNPTIVTTVYFPGIFLEYNTGRQRDSIRFIIWGLEYLRTPQLACHIFIAIQYIIP